MIAYSCNLSCAGCISLSDRRREGIAQFNDIEQWVQQWSEIVTPTVVTVFGGEPCLHPRLFDICKLFRRSWPNTVIRLITNGYLLDNHDSNGWFNFAPFEIQVSVHRKDHEFAINNAIGNILKHRTGWRVQQHGGKNHKQLEWYLDGFSIYKSIFKDFVVPYRQDGDKIVSWDSDPTEAIKICGSPNTPVLYKGRLYKCPPVANIVDLTNVTYQGYTGYAVDDDLTDFVANIGRAESVCGYCPAANNAVVINHFDIKNVQIKQKNFS